MGKIETDNFAQWRLDKQEDDKMFFFGLTKVLVEAGLDENKLLLQGVKVGDDLDTLLSNWKKAIQVFTNSDMEEYFLDDVTWFALQQLKPKPKRNADGTESTDMDISTYYDEKKAFYNEVKQEYGQEALDRLKRKEHASKTRTEKRYASDMERYIVPTWDFAREKAYGDIDPEYVEIHRRFNAMTSQQREAESVDPQNRDFSYYKLVQQRIYQETQRLRKENPIIDSKFIKWGFAKTPLTTIRDVGMFLDESTGTWEYNPQFNKFRSIRDKFGIPNGEASLQGRIDPVAPETATGDVLDLIYGMQDDESRRERNRISRHDVYGVGTPDIDNRMSVP